MWEAKLRSAIEYNRRIFADAGVDFRIAFVEWNPLEDRPLLSPGLVEDYPFLRAVVVEKPVHDALCQSDAIDLMLNFALNCGLHSSEADYLLITGGDDFMGADVAAACGKGLRPGCLYRAERVNIRNDLDFAVAGQEVIEAPENIVSVDSCTTPPHNVAPFTNASGDFLLLDRLSMNAVRGFDESQRRNRLHLDARFCFTCQMAGMDCELIGRVYHVNHARSYVNMLSSYADKGYDYRLSLPYLNPREWGLGDHAWRTETDRLAVVGLPRSGVPAPWLRLPNEDERACINAVVELLLQSKERTGPLAPGPGASTVDGVLDVRGLVAWHECEIRTGAESQVEVAADLPQWAYICSLPFAWEGREPGGCRWARVRYRVEAGKIGMCTLRNEELLQQIFAQAAPEPVVSYIPLGAQCPDCLVFRIADGPTAVAFTLYDVSVVAQPFERLDRSGYTL